MTYNFSLPLKSMFTTSSRERKKQEKEMCRLCFYLPLMWGHLLLVVVANITKKIKLPRMNRNMKPKRQHNEGKRKIEVIERNGKIPRKESNDPPPSPQEESKVKKGKKWNSNWATIKTIKICLFSIQSSQEIFLKKLASAQPKFLKNAFATWAPSLPNRSAWHPSYEAAGHGPLACLDTAIGTQLGTLAW